MNHITEQDKQFEILNNALDAVQIKILEEKIEELKKICQEIDPYQSLTLDMKNRLIDAGVEDLSNPFYITNKLILLLEDAMEELNRLKPFMHDENE
jgi:hypothetical protein